jgi:hypothetical protein
VSRSDTDSFTDDGALQEAQLLDVRIDALRSTVGLLFELRAALQLREANTGVLIAHGVREVSWSVGSHLTPRTAWAVLRSHTEVSGGLFTFSLKTWPESQLMVRAESAAFYLGDVPELDRMPDYVSDDEMTIRASLAGWQSNLIPAAAVLLRSSPPS